MLTDRLHEAMAMQSNGLSKPCNCNCYLVPLYQLDSGFALVGDQLAGQGNCQELTSTPPDLTVYTQSAIKGEWLVA